MPSLLLFAMIFQEEIYLHKFSNQTSSSFSFLILKTHRQSQARLARLALFLLTCKPFMQQSQHFVQTLVFFLLLGPVFKSLRQLSLSVLTKETNGECLVSALHPKPMTPVSVKLVSTKLLMSHLAMSMKAIVQLNRRSVTASGRPGDRER